MEYFSAPVWENFLIRKIITIDFLLHEELVHRYRPTWTPSS